MRRGSRPVAPLNAGPSARGSIADVAVARGGVLRPGSAIQAVLILAKGHAASPSTPRCGYLGIIAPDDFHTYCADGSCSPPIPGIWVAGVSRTNRSAGLSVACGIAYALRLQSSSARVFAL